ncbi:MAG: DNA repair protein RadC [Bacteroidales bacterium]|nr:DNA repair protein RadC [Bacteroidales bacterium]
MVRDDAGRRVPACKPAVRKRATARLTPHFSIRHWDSSERPREKMLAGHPGVLTDSELLAILIGSGSARVSAVELSRQILSAFGGNLHTVAGKTPRELCGRFKGIGEAKAASILAALELGRRMQALPLPERCKITNSRDAFRLLCTDMVRRPYEMFQVLLLTRSNHLIRKVLISEGGRDKILVDPKKIFKIAIDEQASALVLSHNHPSGQLKPSMADMNLTRQIVSGAKLLDLEILDHLIVGISDEVYFSFADEGCLKS